MDKYKKMRELIGELNRASYAYYNTGHPIMDDAEFDYMLDELQRLEMECGAIFPDSPTINAGSKVAKEQKKIVHEHPMLSLNKIHSIDEIKKFAHNEYITASIKLDGLSVSATYINGKLTRLETRGNGDVGTDIMIHKNSIKGLPKKIQHYGKYVVDGECIVTYKDFEKINATLSDNEKFSNPRNMASGSLNLLDSNISSKRGLNFVVWNVIEDSDYFKNDMKWNFDTAKDLGFVVVPHVCLHRCSDLILKDVLLQMKEEAKVNEYPMDGVVFSYTDITYGKSLGRTRHHFNAATAYKFEDEMYETTLTNIEWNTSKSGLVNPVAVFKPIDLDGAITTRATLHNISYIENLQLGVGDTIQVYRSNMVIPKVHDNLTRSNTWVLPNKCPSCGSNVEVHNENGSKTLHCTNDINCPAKLLGKLSHFSSKNAANIDGLSEQTLQKFIELGWLNSFKDIYHLSEHKSEMMKLEGFGKKSVEKLLDAIEKSRSITLDRFIYSLSIPLIGRSASKTIAKYFNYDFKEWYHIGISQPFRYTLLDDFGETMQNSIYKFAVNMNMIIDLADEFTFEKVEEKSSNSNADLSELTFCITGSLNHYKNRNELVETIEGLGGKVSGSISAKTNYLINNDKESKSSKNIKAQNLGISIISEGDFLKMIGE